MERTAVYNFAGCVLEDAPFLTPFLPSGHANAPGMSTEGILRLFTGDSLALCAADYSRLSASRPGLSENFGRYDTIDPRQVKAILWTPVVDATFLYPHACCADKTVYPVHDNAINTVLGSTKSSFSWSTINALWSHLDGLTRDIPLRGIVNYPTDHLESTEWKSRIDSAQETASDFLAEWETFWIEPELVEGDGYWAHFSDRAKRNLWREVESQL